MKERNYKVTTNEQYCEAIKAIMHQKGVNHVSFDRKTYDENTLTKNEMPWCVLFDEFISTVCVPSLMTEELEGLAEIERAFIKGAPNCIALVVENKGGQVMYDLFNGETHCHSTGAEDYGEEDYIFIFEEVYCYLWDGGMEDDESEIWLEKNGFFLNLEPECLLEDIRRAADAVAEARGMNVSYCESMDLGDVFPAIVEFALDPDNLGENEDNILGTLRFVSNDESIFPKEMKTASLEQFKEYFDHHYQELLVMVRIDVDHYLAEFEKENTEQNERFHPTECPYCGCEIVHSNGYWRFLCPECHREFSFEDHEFETTRHRISALLSAYTATEERPMKLDITIRSAHITGAFHDSEAIVWLILDGCSEQPVAIDTLSLSLKEVLDIENAMLDFCPFAD